MSALCSRQITAPAPHHSVFYRPDGGDWKCETWKYGTVRNAGPENARHEFAAPVCTGGNCGTWKCRTNLQEWKLRDMKMRDQFAGEEMQEKLVWKAKVWKVSQNSCIYVQSYSFSISFFDKWMWNGTIPDNRTRLLMKLLTTSSADIIQECHVMFSVKSVSKSIFKRRRRPNILPVVVFKMSNIRRRKLNNHGLRGSASPVLTATGFVNGRWQFSTPTE